MATIGGLSSSSSNASSIRGYGGLASGLDRDTLIENMTYATTSKIKQKQQAKQKVAWTQEAMRGITDSVYSFNQSFISYTSSKSLLSSKLFRAGSVTPKGVNSGCISVTGTSSTADSMTIVGVKQLASNAKLSFSGNASDRKLESGGIPDDLSTEKDFNAIAGTSLTIKYGNKYYSVSLPEDNKDYSYDNLTQVTEALNKAMGEITIGEDKTLADVISVTESGGKLTFKNTDTAGNTIKLAGSTGKLLTNLGFTETTGGIEITDTGVEAASAATLTEHKSIAAQIGGKQIAVSYNGKTEWITLATEEELRESAKGNTLESLTDDLQAKLDKTFGKGRIKVGRNAAGTGESSLSFMTTDPKTGLEDKSSVLAIGSGERGLLGRYGALTGLSAGDSNRLNLDTALLKSGLKTAEGKTFPTGGKLTINGVDIEVKEESTLREIMDAVNSSEAGVKMSYLSDADKFVVTSTQDGASGSISIEGEIGELLFGKEADGDYTIQRGQDAVVAIKYDGSDEAVEVTRGSNSFAVNGLTITAKGLFGYAADGTLDTSAEGVTFDVKMDTEPATTAVKEMIEAFNEMVKLINDEVSTKPNRKYAPLTSEQEDDMSESEIKAWNEKAKAGLLFNDSDVRGLADGLRSMISQDAAVMKKMGITVSTSYADNGKLVFDEEAFKSALETDPEAVLDAFTRPESTNDDGKTVDKGGLMVRLQTLVNKYASTTGATKGILIERAGSQYAPTSILTNSMQKQMDEIDDEIDRLMDKLEMEQDRYISQFTTLETLISQMNSQSSWLSNAFGA